MAGFLLSWLDLNPRPFLLGIWRPQADRSPSPSQQGLSRNAGVLLLWQLPEVRLDLV
jgi:hypothetical protein